MYFLKLLNPDNLLIILSSKKFNNLIKIGKYYGTKH